MLNNNKAFNDQAEQNMKPLRESLEEQRKYIDKSSAKNVPDK